MPSSEIEVLAANQAFYDAFIRGDLAAIDALWAQRAPVACIHPGWDALHGREDVMASWRAILSGEETPTIRCARPSAYLLGESAYVVCSEVLGGAELVATNVFCLEDGEWRLVLHQAGQVHRRVERKPPRAPNRGMLN
jgi:SnoaL-like domain